MSTLPPSLAIDLVFELRFESIQPRGPSLSFPCDKSGRVDLDELSDRSRSDYLYAHTLIGRDFTMPVVRVGMA